MSRQSAFRGTWQPNRRPYVTMAPDVYVAIQGETTVIGCGECRRRIDLNRYVTSVSTEASVDSPPGSATVTLTVPDTDINDFFVDGQLVVIPMMEIEVFSKGYFLVGGFPQYYRIFWGIVSSVTKAWSNGSTTITISCKDILRWWELTNVTINPGFIESFGSSTGNFTFWGNQFAGMNPYTVIIALAKEAMGDFSLTTGSFTSFLPEKGAESPVIASYAKDIMAYWQLKFGNIWNSLVLYGTSGQAYSFSGESGTFSPVQVAAKIFAEEERLNFLNQESNVFKINPGEVATFKQQIDRAVDFDFFQSETQSKLALATASRDQAGYEFFCDPSGDIVFKPPFFNLNVMPNKPVSWIQDFEVIDDSVTDSEAEVYTHITASGNAFGGVMDFGLNDEITTPRAGVFDYHLLRRYGWRRFDYQCEWAGNPRKLFFHLIDYLDRLNAKRQNGSVTIPLRPELRLGFPIWFPKYDSFFYVVGISHNYQVGGQATTSLTLSAKRSKFIAPNNIGEVRQTGVVKKTVPAIGSGKADKAQSASYNEAQFTIEFPDRAGASASIVQEKDNGTGVKLYDPKTGKLLGYPNAVMVFRASHRGETLAKIIETMGQKPAASGAAGKVVNDKLKYTEQVAGVYKMLQGEERAQVIARLRAHRYEAGMTNAGAYDYALDRSRQIKEMVIIPTDRVTWLNGGEEPAQGAYTVGGKDSKEKQEAIKKKIAEDSKAQQEVVKAAKKSFDDATKAYKKAEAELKAIRAKFPKAPKAAAPVAKGDTGKTAAGPEPPPVPPEVKAKEDQIAELKAAATAAGSALTAEESKLKSIKDNQSSMRMFTSLNMMVRPVSDDFGFEVIGHYRYGRGAFIDRGQVQIKIEQENKQSIANQLNIQFAPVGGLLTDAPAGTALDPGSVAQSSTFERMQPDDYVTGASFKGKATNAGAVEEIMLTSQATYTNSVNANVGRGVFIEADSLRRAKTLGELSPTIALGGLDGAFAPCRCSLSTPRWLNYMPRAFVDKVLSTGFGTYVAGAYEERNTAPDPGVQKDIEDIDDRTNKALIDREAKHKADIAAVLKGAKPGDVTTPAQAEKLKALQDAYERDYATLQESRKKQKAAKPSTTSELHLVDKQPDVGAVRLSEGSGDFFGSLAKFLQEELKLTYEVNNAVRERVYTASDSSVDIRDLSSPAEQDNVLSAPGGSLFDRAAQGDPAALKEVQAGANFNFGSTVESSKKFDAAVSKAGVDLGFSPGPQIPGEVKQPPVPVLPLKVPVIGSSRLGDSLSEPAVQPPLSAVAAAPTEKQLESLQPVSKAPKVVNRRRGR